MKIIVQEWTAIVLERILGQDSPGHQSHFKRGLYKCSCIVCCPSVGTLDQDNLEPKTLVVVHPRLISRFPLPIIMGSSNQH